MPREVAPALTAFSAYSIWTSLPLGLKVVREKEYCSNGHKPCCGACLACLHRLRRGTADTPWDRQGRWMLVNHGCGEQTYLRLPHRSGWRGRLAAPLCKTISSQ